MKKIYFLPLSLLALNAAAVSLPDDFFPPNSPLASGRWVKVRVDSTGVQCIPFEVLRAMGFENPQQVAVFGRGAYPAEEQFVDIHGLPQIEGEMAAAASATIGDSLFFYGVASEYLQYIERPDSAGGNYFSRPLRHSGSRAGYYLLTDSQLPLRADNIDSDVDIDIDALPVAASAETYLYYHRDSVQGFGHGGQIFFSDLFTSSVWQHKWTVKPEDPVTGARAALDTRVITDTQSAGNSVRLSLDNESISGFWTPRTASFLSDIFTEPLVGTLHRTSPTISLQVTGANSIQNAGIDYWALTYSRRLPAPADRQIVFAASADNVVMPIHSGIARPAVWDITDPLKPKVIPARESSGKHVAVIPADILSSRRITTFDAAAPKYFPVSEGEIPNSNLHSRAAEGADLLIITTPALHTQAQRLADLHAQKDNITTLIADVDSIYNEYSSGTPSAMAYKSLIKHIKQANGQRHLNVLLFGPVKNDVFTQHEIPDYSSFIIAYQSPEIDSDLIGHSIIDFLGMLDDHITTRPEYSTITAGIGVLPVLTPGEADRIIDKIEGYMNFPDHHLYADNMLAIAGPGDKNTHLDQVKNLMNNYQTYYNQSLIQTPVVADCYYPNEISDVAISRFNKGYSMGIYMGHGTAYALQSSSPIFQKTDIHRFTNKALPFYMFGTCDLAEFDRGGRGLAESMLLDTKAGIIGGVLTTRMAYSTQNESLLRLMGQYLTQGKSGQPALKQAKSVGQAWAEAKTQLRTSHENTFNLVADPALKLAVPVLDVRIDQTSPMTVEPGGAVTYTGRITTRKGSDVAGFNGKICAKVIGPASAVTVENLTSKDQVSKLRTITYADNVLGISEGEVADSRFSITVHAPVCSELRDGISVSLAFSAYDPKTLTAASGMECVTVVIPDPEEGDLDNDAPSIADVHYDEQLQQLAVTITDNRSIAFRNHSLVPGLEIILDGRHVEDYADADYNSGTPAILNLRIPASHLNAGEHFVEITAHDYSGNRASYSGSFTSGSPLHFCRLIAPEYIDGTSADFAVENSLTDNPTGRLTIADTRGNTILSIPFSGAEFTAEIADADGNPLPEGIYRAYVICDAPGFESSRAVTFAVVNASAAQ